MGFAIPRSGRRAITRWVNCGNCQANPRIVWFLNPREEKSPRVFRPSTSAALVSLRRGRAQPEPRSDPARADEKCRTFRPYRYGSFLTLKAEIGVWVAGCDKSGILSVGYPTKMYKIEHLTKLSCERKAERGRSNCEKIGVAATGSGVFDNDNAAFACCILRWVLD